MPSVPRVTMKGSMPPEMMTKHIPTAMMPMKAVRVSTFIALSQVAKSGLSTVPTMHSSTRPTMGPASSRCWRSGLPPRFGVEALSAERARSCMGSVSAGGMGDELLFGQVVGVQGGLHGTGAHHHHAVTQADQFHQLRGDDDHATRSEEHTSELQSQSNL